MTAHARAMLALALLGGGCALDAGTPCRYDHHCFSNSCTWGSCDGYLGAALGEAISGDSSPEIEDDEEDEAWEPDASTPPQRDCPLQCGVLTGAHSCEQAEGCHAEWRCRYPNTFDCFTSECLTARCDSGAASERECPAPCVWEMLCAGQRQCDDW